MSDKEILGELDLLWAQIDADHSDQIEFTEWAMAASNKEALLTDKRLRQAFCMFDVDWSGSISSEEIQKMLEPFVKQ
jgi:Ca2+-binding EF-hand superfamily protein